MRESCGCRIVWGVHFFVRRHDVFNILMGVLAVTAVIALTIGLPILRDLRRKAIDLGPLHTFVLEQTPEFLAESLAIEKAQEAMRRDDFNLLEWEIAEDDRSQAPDGSQDKYLSRNTLNPNDGCLMFVNNVQSQVRSVRIQLHGSEVRCQVWRHR